MSWFYDRTWQVNGFVAEAVVSSPGAAAEWLRATAVRRYPATRFAMMFARSANDP